MTPDGCIAPPRVTFAAFFAERWLLDTPEHERAAARRGRALRKALGSTVSTSRVEITRRWSAELGAERVTVPAVEITYNDPHSRAPALVEMRAA